MARGPRRKFLEPQRIQRADDSRVDAVGAAPAGGRDRMASVLLWPASSPFRTGYRGLSRSGAAAGRGPDSAQRAQRRGSREAGNRTARVRAGRDARSERDALDFAVRPLGYPLLLRLGQRLLLGSGRDDQPPRLYHAAAGRHARDLARESDRRNLSLHGREPRPRPDQGEGDRGLGPREAAQDGAGRRWTSRVSAG